jgi:L-fuculose-phosphate aldolase
MSEVIIRDKAEYHARTTDEMQRHLTLPPWSLRQKIALTCRILAAEGHESALAGQITARGDRPGTYWMLSFGLGFDEARASNLLLVDDDLQLLEGDGMVNPSNRFHLWIYRRRPNVNAIVHTHPPYCSALSVVGQPLVAAHMDTAMFYDDCAYLAEWPGPPIGDEEGRIIHEALAAPSCWLITASWSRPQRLRKQLCSQCSSSAQRACRSWRNRLAPSRRSTPRSRRRHTTTG